MILSSDMRVLLLLLIVGYTLTVFVGVHARHSVSPGILARVVSFACTFFREDRQYVFWDIVVET